MKRTEIRSAVLLLLFGCASDSIATNPNHGFAGNTSVLPPVGTGGARAGSGGVGAAVQPTGQGTAGRAGAGGMATVTGAAGTAAMMMGTAGASGGKAGAGGAAATGAAGAGGGIKTSKDPKIPAISGDCPKFAENMPMGNFMGLSGIVWVVGPKSNGTGTLLFYWHGTGSSNTEFMANVPFIDEFKSMGGILVSPQSGTGSGGDCSGTATFSMDDFKVADQIAACAVRDWGIDPHRIWATGCSAGGLQSGCMALVRSSYMAGAVPNSGGEYVPIGQEDMSHTPSMMTVHGAAGSDVVIVDFSSTSKMIDDQVKSAGGFAIDCDHGDGHCHIPALPADVATAGWQFMKDHPFGVSPEPYTTLPTSFPSYCKIW
jgi:hypothetical protein